MKKNIKRILTVIMLITIVFTLTLTAFAADDITGEASEVETSSDALSGKALAAAITVGIAAAAGAIGMGWAIAKSAEAIRLSW